jgi:hypothetical protein
MLPVAVRRQCVRVVSYDIYFLHRELGQSWQQALDALEEGTKSPQAPSRPACWDQVVSGVQDVLGAVSVLEGPPEWEIDDQRTAIQVSCFSGEWSMSVPYWWRGDTARVIAESIRAIAAIVHGATGLDAYDPQLETGVMSGEWSPGKAAAVFDQVARSFDQRGIRQGGTGSGTTSGAPG